MEEKQNFLNEDPKRIIKNLYFNSDTGKFILIDNQNNSFLCDMFGRQKHLFKRSLSYTENAFNTLNQENIKLNRLIYGNFKKNKNKKYIYKKINIK